MNLKKRKENQKENLKSLINNILIAKIDEKVDIAQDLKQGSHFDKAVKKLKNALTILDKISKPKKKKRGIKEKLQKRIREIRESKIRKTILDLGTKFSRLKILEIAEECEEEENIIITIVKEMIENKEIYAKYFSSTNRNFLLL